MQRVADEETEEVILATNPDTEGKRPQCTFPPAAAVRYQNHPPGYGMPVGGHLELVDEVTLLRALEGRRGCNRRLTRPLF